MKLVRRIALAAVATVLMCAAVAGSTSTFLMLTGKALVVGGLEPCDALGVSNGPHFAAGTVTVLRGIVEWKSTGAGNSAAVFPAAVVAQQRLGENAFYWFVLSPGKYVIEGQYVPGTATAKPWIELTVAPGTVSHVDVPNMCI